MIILEQTAGVARLTLNRTDARNALNSAMMADLGRHLDTVANDRETKVLVVQAAGAAFSAGRDLKEAPTLPLATALQQHDDWASVFQRLQRLTIPSVAVVQGFAVAGDL